MFSQACALRFLTTSRWASHVITICSLSGRGYCRRLSGGARVFFEAAKLGQDRTLLDYSCGLRLKGAAAVKVVDIDSQPRMVLHLGKGPERLVRCRASAADAGVHWRDTNRPPGSSRASKRNVMTDGTVRAWICKRTAALRLVKQVHPHTRCVTVSPLLEASVWICCRCRRCWGMPRPSICT